MKKNKRYIALIAAGIICFGIFSGCGEDGGSEQTTEIVNSADDGKQNNTEEIKTIPSPSVSEAKANLPQPSNELYEKIKKVGIACERYYSKSKAEKEFFSWAGFLAYYDEANNPTDVTVNKLNESGYLKGDSMLNDALILYIKPTDIDPSFKKTSLDVFAAVETSDGFIVSGVGFDEKLIPSDEFRKMILKYNIDNGVVSNPKTGGEVYNSLMAAIGVFRQDIKPEQSNVPEYIVRYAANNDLYAVVILSGTDDVTDTTEYLLKKDNNGWVVVENALENQEDVKKYLNTKYTDFDLNILPPYTLYIYRKQVRTTEHYEEILNMLKEQKIVDSSEEVTYCCGTQHVLYMEFASGKKLAGGAKKDGSFSCNFVNNYEEAIKELGKFVQPVPAFILKYNH